MHVRTLVHAQDEGEGGDPQQSWPEASFWAEEGKPTEQKGDVSLVGVMP